MAVEVKIEGFDELARKLRELAPAMRKRVLRNALSAGARLVRDEAKRKAPVLNGTRKAPYRKPGTVKNAIKVRISKVASRGGDVGVFVNVKPLNKSAIKAFKASGGGSGYKNPNDPFYWRWLEFGRNARAGQSARTRVARIKRAGSVLVKGIRARRALRGVGRIQPFGFLQSGAKRLPEALKIFQTQVGGWIEKVNRTGKVIP